MAQENNYNYHKLQAIELLNINPCLKGSDHQVAIAILTRVIKSDWEGFVTDAELADYLHISERTVSRSVKALASSKIFNVRRGKINRATEYKIATGFEKRIRDHKEKPDKAVIELGGLTRQNRSSNPSNLSGTTPQGCHPNRELRKKKEVLALKAQIETEIGIPMKVVPLSSRCFQLWEANLRSEHGIVLREDVLSEQAEGEELFLFPDCDPTHLRSRSDIQIFAEHIKKNSPRLTSKTP